MPQLSVLLLVLAAMSAISYAVPQESEEAKPATTASQPATEAGQDLWLLAYFRQRYEGRVEIDEDGRVYQVRHPWEPMHIEQLHLASSTDGRHWTPLNDNKPAWDQRMRDPFIRRGPDGLWHLLATGRQPGTRREQTGPMCLHAVSRDLITWDVEYLTLMQGAPLDDQGQAAPSIWAPEWFYDEASGDVILLWTSSYESAGWQNASIWYCRTRDWKTFTPPQVLFAPFYSAIDGNLWEHEGTYYLFHKEEVFGASTGERRAIRVATADQLEGPYAVHQGPLNNGQITPTITEGPAIMPDPVGQGWLLLYDLCMSNAFGVSSSNDLLHWKIEQDVQFPPDARHGSVFRLSAGEFQRLRQAVDQGSP